MRRNLCSGPSQQEKDLAEQQAQFTQTLQQDYSQTFANNQEILSTLNSVLQPIVTAGPGQQGYSAEELSALNSQAINSNAEVARQTTQAVNAQENAEGGGTKFLPSGVNQQINAGIQTAAESNLANEELGITTSNYATGRQNWQNALAGEESVASGEAPLGYAGATTTSNQAAFGEADTVNTESQQLLQSILGAIPGVGPAIAGGIGNLDTKATSTGGEQVGNFLAGL